MKNQINHIYDLKDLVRNSVEETLNGLLDKEADELVNAEKYERSSNRQGYRSGHYKRDLHTTAGEVELKVPKLKGVPFETAIIERYRRRESSVEEVLIEMYLTGVPVRFLIKQGILSRKKQLLETRGLSYLRSCFAKGGQNKYSIEYLAFVRPVEYND